MMTTRLAGIGHDIPADEGAREVEQVLPTSQEHILGDPGVQEQTPEHGVRVQPPCEACRGEHVLPPRLELGLDL